MVNPIKSTTQDALDIEDITSNLLILKDGGCALVIQIQSINFDLLSEEEQDAIIYSYAGLLNSLTFPIQILIRSQKKDISAYIKLLEVQEMRQLNPVYKQRLQAYRAFIQKIVKERNVLDKKFFVVIPFFATELGLSTGTASYLNPLAKRRTTLPFDKSYIIDKALNTLEPKRDHLLRQFTHLNLQARQLNTQELIHLFYSAYNSDAADTIHALTKDQLTTPITQAVISPAKSPPPPQPTSMPTVPTPQTPAQSQSTTNIPSN